MATWHVCLLKLVIDNVRAVHWNQEISDANGLSLGTMSSSFMQGMQIYTCELYRSLDSAIHRLRIGPFDFESIYLAFHCAAQPVSKLAVRSSLWVPS